MKLGKICLYACTIYLQVWTVTSRLFLVLHSLQRLFDPSRSQIPASWLELEQFIVESAVLRPAVSNSTWRTNETKSCAFGNVMLLEKLVGIKRRLGVYRFLPLFFFIGAGIELFMIKVRIGRETFCK